jgi:hypothetical protein
MSARERRMARARALGLRVMNPPAIRLVRATIALSCASAILLGAAGPAGAAEITYEHESEQQWKAQLAAHEIASITINKRAQSLRTTLKDGRYVVATYPKHQYPRVVQELAAKHVQYKVLSKAAAAQLAKSAPHHHKWRYIIGGVLLALIVLVGGFIFIRRRGPAD